MRSASGRGFEHAHMPNFSREYRHPKLRKNKLRGKENEKKLRQDAWTILTRFLGKPAK